VNTYYVTINNKEYPVTIGHDGVVKVFEKSMESDYQRIDGHTFSVLVDGQSYVVVAQKEEDGYQILLNGRQLFAGIESERTRLLKQFESQASTGTKKLEVKAPMPALVVKVEVAVGDDVTPGQGLVVLEAMKMENEIKAHSSGKVREIFVAKGTPVEKGQLLLLLE
jgi:biotin carboxyl carrier protein